MNINQEIAYIHDVINKVWLEDISNDYSNKCLLKEDSLKNALYFHLRRRLGDDFLTENNLRIFTEYYVDGERIDLVIVEIDKDKAEEYFLGDCVKRVLAVVEIKFKSGLVSDSVFYKDVDKILSFIQSWGSETKHYLAFVQERYYKTRDVESWIKDKHLDIVKGKLTELYSYWDEDSDEVIWSSLEH
ncbi:hypothetical protein [Metabacillus litoralis]|uniref:hypothetical protein n=1 Tax=Metabacillus litoralis TaxID=152268 RepID=UPI00203AA78A|nr:hypothetical protein [Metabacillus litoralis]MCM3162719.1 hypothetical protein [Metabacillus litoralis]